LGRQFGEENANKLLLSSSPLSRYDILVLFKKIIFSIYICALDYLRSKSVYITLITTNGYKDPAVVSFLNMDFTVRLTQVLGTVVGICTQSCAFLHKNFSKLPSPAHRDTSRRHVM
jgi:hypothetical protein